MLTLSYVAKLAAAIVDNTPLEGTALRADWCGHYTKLIFAECSTNQEAHELAAELLSLSSPTQAPQKTTAKKYSDQDLATMRKMCNYASLEEYTRASYARKRKEIRQRSNINKAAFFHGANTLRRQRRGKYTY